MYVAVGPCYWMLFYNMSFNGCVVFSLMGILIWVYEYITHILICTSKYYPILSLSI